MMCWQIQENNARIHAAANYIDELEEQVSKQQTMLQVSPYPEPCPLWALPALVLPAVSTKGTSY